MANGGRRGEVFGLGRVWWGRDGDGSMMQERWAG